MPILNREALLGHGMTDVREVALDVAEAGLAELDPTRAVLAQVRLEGSHLIVADRSYDLGCADRIMVVGAGKASLGVVRGLEMVLGDWIHGGMVVVPSDQAAASDLKRVSIKVADHPLPSKRSVKAAAQLLECAERVGPNDLVIVSITGGSSSLASSPPPGVSQREKRHLHRLLLASGASIREVNAVRKHVSSIKGGRLAERMAPARIINLTVSDVAGNPQDCITDPSVQDTSTAEQARDVLTEYGLWDRVAPSIRAHLNSPAAESPDLDSARIQTVMLVTGEDACAAMAARAVKHGFTPIIAGTSWEGEARDVGAIFAGIARETYRAGRPFAPPCVLLGCGGETTVRLSAVNLGRGGPNQEAALSAALALDSRDRIAAVWLDTDGSDGGTEFAGAVVDGLTCRRASEAGLGLRTALRFHRSAGSVLELSDAVLTGPTYTNVNDLFVIAVGRPGPDWERRLG